MGKMGVCMCCYTCLRSGHTSSKEKYCSDLRPQRPQSPITKGRCFVVSCRAKRCCCCC